MRKQAAHAQAASGLRLRMLLHAELAAREVRKEGGEGVGATH